MLGVGTFAGRFGSVLIFSNSRSLHAFKVSTTAALKRIFLIIIFMIIGFVGLKIYGNIQSIGSWYRNVTAFYALHISATVRKLRVDVFAFRIDVPKVPAVKGYIKPGYTDVVFDAELIAKHYLSEFEK